MPRYRRSINSTIAALLVMPVLAATVSCSSAGGVSDPMPSTVVSGSTGTDVRGGITVFAAASLTAAYTEIGEAFTNVHPDSDVTLNFASSSELVTQIVEGAPADVFASADEANMIALTDAVGSDADPVVFATNSLEIIVEPGNPKGITGVADLGKDDVLYVTCAPQVPIGQYSAQVLAAAGVTVTPVSLEENVKSIVTKVTLGEADAGIVYTTDVIAAGDQADGVDIPAELGVVVTYPMVVTADAPNPRAARAFVQFVAGEQGQQILRSFGFGSP